MSPAAVPMRNPALGVQRLPGVAKAEGISKVIVNGTLLYTDGKHTGAFPGRVLRSK